MSFHDDERASALPADLDAALSRLFPDGEEAYAAAAAAEVVSRAAPHVEDADDLVEALFPYDGPHGPYTVRTAAAVMSRTGRYLNNATQHSRTVDSGQALASLVGAAKTTLYQFDQLLDQLADAALRLAENPDLYSDQVPYDRDTPREEWDAARHAAGVRTAMELADQLRQVRADLVQVDASGILPVGGAAFKLEKPHSLANQLGLNTYADGEED